MSNKRDELGEFLEAYDLYFKGELEYNELPVFGDVKLWPPYEATCFKCHKSYTRKSVLIRASKQSITQSLPIHCPECTEIIGSGPQKSLPVARVIKR